MADLASPPSSPAVSPLSASPKIDDPLPVAPKIAELDEVQSELLTKLRGLKQDVNNWRSKLDTQVKAHKDELSQLKDALNTELEQLRTEFQELRTTLQKQQEDVTASLKNLGLQDGSDHPVEHKIQDDEEKSPLFLGNNIETEPSDVSTGESSH